jgi:hypothetical protein
MSLKAAGESRRPGTGDRLGESAGFLSPQWATMTDHVAGRRLVRNDQSHWSIRADAPVTP